MLPAWKCCYAAPVFNQKFRLWYRHSNGILINNITNTNHPSHTHKAKQTQYTLLHTAKRESDGAEMAVYIDGSSQVWVRPMSEFQEKFTENPVVFVPPPEFFDDEDDWRK